MYFVIEKNLNKNIHAPSQKNSQITAFFGLLIISKSLKRKRIDQSQSTM